MDFSILSTHTRLVNWILRKIFTENEVIRGYENLSVTVYLTPCTLKPLVEVRYTRKAKVYDDIQAILNDHYTRKSKFVIHI